MIILKQCACTAIICICKLYFVFVFVVSTINDLECFWQRVDFWSGIIFMFVDKTSFFGLLKGFNSVEVRYHILRLECLFVLLFVTENPGRRKIFKNFCFINQKIQMKILNFSSKDY